MALRTPCKGCPLGTYNRSIRESQRVQGLRSKLSPKELSKEDNLSFQIITLRITGATPISPFRGIIIRVIGPVISSY